MLKYFDPFEVRRVTLPEDQGPVKTVFLVGRLDAVLAAAIFDNLTRYGVSEDGQVNSEATVKLRNNRKVLEVVRFGVKGWEDLDGPAFDKAKHTTKHQVPDAGEREGLTDEALTYLRPYTLKLAAEAESFTRVSEDQEKN